MARFFIDRPIFAWVLAIITVLIGLLSISTLPLEQYPDIAPPTISVSATYPGASAETVQNSVTQLIEQQMTGLDNLLYMSSSSSAAGTANLTLTFDTGTDPDTAQVQVQNKVAQAESQLPEEVRVNGVTVTKSLSGSVFMVVAVTSEDSSMDVIDVADYVASTLQEPLSRVSGIGGVTLFGSEYAMRIWLNPERMAHYQLTPADVTSALRAQNADVSSGSLGGLPSTEGQRLTASIRSRTKLKTVEQFQRVVLKSEATGAAVYLEDVARVEIGSESYGTVAQFNGKPASGMGLQLAAGANALAVSGAVDAKLKELAPYFPTGLKYNVAYDTTPFVKISVEEVIKTLLEAIALVVLIMYLFLQNWRATLVPVVAVPVVLMGTFGVLAAFGYSINTLTMFAMVLAIGLLVDDAIVVVENVERMMSEEGLDPKEATIRSMEQITSALVGIALVLTAVFVPMAFFDGATGEIYRQFSVTIAAAMILSVGVALTLSPAMCATMLAPIEKGGHTSKKGPLGRFFAWFNTTFDRNADRYQRGVERTIGHKKIGLLAYAIAIIAMILLFWRLPSSFIPEEDQGTMMVLFNMAPSATQEQTLDAISKTTDVFLEQPEVASIMTMAGYSASGSGQNSGMAFVRLRPWDERDASAAEIGQRINDIMAATLRDGRVTVVSPPALPGLGSSSGFTMQLQDVAGAGHDELVAARDELLQKAAGSELLTAVRFNSLLDAPSLDVTLNDEKASALGLNLGEVNQALSTVMGGTYVNDYLAGARVKRVYVQGEAEARMLPQDIGRWHVRNSSGDMVPFSTFSRTAWAISPLVLERFNGVEAMEITGSAAPGVSSGDAMAEIARLAGELPQETGLSWSDLSYQEQASGSGTWMVYAISLVFVFLCLAALYESWTIPVSVMLAVPVGIVGALLATSLRGLTSDIYFQVGLVATIGLAAKNGILIVEFARELENQGKGLVEATLEAARMRLRPILMTSLAFMLGVLPMVLSSGAGAAGRHSLGTGVLGGTLFSTVLGIFFVPLFYVMVRTIFPGKKAAKEGAAL